MFWDLSSATPESQGVPAEAVVAFMDELERKKVNMHSFILMKKGHILAQCYWPYFDAAKKQRMYSVSKSVTSVAVGKMITEGRLSLADKVAPFFPEYITADTHPYLLEATVRDLLMMATPNHTNSYDYPDPDWIKTFFNLKGEKVPPGTRFSYDTAGTDTLCAIVEKLCGMPMLKYLRPVFDEIGISEDAWCIKNPEGRSWSGSGVMFTTRDLAKFALFCLDKGECKGKQLVSREYMEAATSFQIGNAENSGGDEFRYGYGYQFWMIRHGGFACYGMGGQLALVLPDKELVLVTTADTQADPSGINSIVRAFFALYEKTSGAPLPENAEAQAALSKKISGAYVHLPEGAKETPNAAAYSGVRYQMEPNPMGIKWLSLEIAPKKCVLNYENATGAHRMAFGTGEYTTGKFPEKYHGTRVGVSDTHYDTAAAGAWTSDDTFSGLLYSVDDHMGSIKMKLAFRGDEVFLDMEKYAQWFFDAYQGSAKGIRA